MHSYIRRWSVLSGVCLILLGGCVHKPQSVGLLREAGTIVVVPFVPNELKVVGTGLTIFENSLDVVDVSDWNLNEITFAAAKDALSPRFAVIRGSVERVAKDYGTPLDDLVNERQSAETRNILTVPISELLTAPDSTRNHVVQNGPADLIVVISDIHRPIKNAPNIIPMGASIFKAMHLFSSRPPICSMLLEISVVDATNLKVIASAVTSIPALGVGKLPNEASNPHTATRILENFEWKRKWAEMDSAQHSQIRTEIETLLRQSIPYSFKNLGLHQ